MNSSKMHFKLTIFFCFRSLCLYESHSMPVMFFCSEMELVKKFESAFTTVLVKPHTTSIWHYY